MKKEESKFRLYALRGIPYIMSFVFLAVGFLAGLKYHAMKQSLSGVAGQDSRTGETQVFRPETPVILVVPDHGSMLYSFPGLTSPQECNPFTDPYYETPIQEDVAVLL